VSKRPINFDQNDLYRYTYDVYYYGYGVKQLHRGVVLWIMLSFVFGWAVFAVEWRQEVTMYESYGDVEESVLIDDTATVVKKVPKDLWDVQIDQRWRIKPWSIGVYSFDGIESLCSLAVKLFLQEVTALKPYQGVTDNEERLWKWDAITLIKNWIKKDYLISLPSEHRELRRFLTKTRQKNRAHSMFDVLIHTENENASYDTNAWYQQWHRIVIFLWSDAHWYVYDPFVSPYTTKPHALKEYIQSDLWKWWVHYTLPYGYAAQSYEHSVASYSDGSMQARLDETIDTIHENTLWEIEDYSDDISSLFGVMKRPLPPLI